MNKAIAVILLLCGVVIIVTQVIEMLNDRPILLVVGCMFFLGGLVGLIRAKPSTKAGRHD
jgi:hypothetical protein